MVKDIFPGKSGSDPYQITTAGSFAIFMASDGANGTEPWITDGTTAGTHLLKDINPGPAPSNALFFTVVNGNIYFGASDGTNGFELWMSDGTTAGTNMLKDINPTGGSSPTRFTKFKDKIYFQASDGASGLEPWYTDGTAAGTQMLTDLQPGTAPSYSISFTEYKDHLYFVGQSTAGDVQLFRTDGTGTNTVQIAPPGPSFLNPLSPHSGLFVYDDALYLGADYGVIGRELWQLTDTTPTNSIVDIQPIDVEVFPNPSRGAFTVKLKNGITNGSITVFDVLGKLMHEQAVEGNSANIVLRSPAKGIYLVKLESGDAVITKRITVE